MVAVDVEGEGGPIHSTRPIYKNGPVFAPAASSSLVGVGSPGGGRAMSLSTTSNLYNRLSRRGAAEDESSSPLLVYQVRKHTGFLGGLVGPLGRSLHKFDLPQVKKDKFGNPKRVKKVLLDPTKGIIVDENEKVRKLTTRSGKLL